MDAYEATRIVFSRIQTLDPENAAKIMGLLLIQDHGEKEMIRLAFGPETLLQSVILKARKEIGSSNPGTPTSTGPTPFLRQNSVNSIRLPSPLSVSSPSWAPPVFTRSNSCNGTGTVEEQLQVSDDLMSPASPFFNNTDLIDELQLQEQLSFLNETAAQNEFLDYANIGNHHRRSCSVSDICFSGTGEGLGWKPCLYFARGYCKNGTSCRFVHGLPDESSMLEQELLLRSKSQRLMGNGFPFSPTGSMPASPNGSNKCLNFFLQQQQNENQRAVAAAAAALMLGGDDAHKFMGRSRFDRMDFMSIMNPGSRQIYLTFPADSTFREEDVSNYFSIYGPVQDVRIPYQQKRMFGFVTFIYPETVKLILAKGNPHFICDARVLVKPYKEKGKIPEKYRTKPAGDFSGCTTPTGLDSRDPFDLQQLGARMMHANNNTEMIIRRKLEEQQQAAELQQAIELQSRRLMGLQFLDLKSRGPVSSPNGNGNSNPGFNSMVVGSPTIAPIAIGTRSNSISPDENRTEGKSSEEGNSFGTVNSGSADKEESTDETSPNADSDFQESSVEHNLPDSPFASPKGGKSKSAFAGIDVFAGTEGEITMVNGKNGNGHLLGSPLLSPASSLDLSSSKSCSKGDMDGMRSWAIGM